MTRMKRFLTSGGTITEKTGKSPKAKQSLASKKANGNSSSVAAGAQPTLSWQKVAGETNTSRQKQTEKDPTIF